MSKGTGWVPLDKMLVQEFKHIRRAFSKIEAMYSYTVDVNNGIHGTIKGYAKLWGWSRNKARKFLNDIRTPEGHQKDTRRTQEGHPIHFIDKGLWALEDTKRTQEGHQKDTRRYPTINPNPNPKEKPSSKVPFEGDKKKEVYKTKKGKSLSGNCLLSFEKFWESFGYKSGKAEAADSWLNIPSLTEPMVDQICAAAKIENSRREELCASGKTPKMAQGWISGRRWDDGIYTEQHENSISPDAIRKKYGLDK